MTSGDGGAGSAAGAPDAVRLVRARHVLTVRLATDAGLDSELARPAG